MEETPDNNLDTYMFVTETKKKYICNVVLLVVGILICVGVFLWFFFLYSIFFAMIELVIFMIAVAFDLFSTYKSSLIHTIKLDKTTGKGTFHSRPSACWCCCGEKRSEFNMIDVNCINTVMSGFCARDDVVYYQVLLSDGTIIKGPNAVPVFRLDQMMKFINSYQAAVRGQRFGQSPYLTGMFYPGQGAGPYQSGISYPVQGTNPYLSGVPSPPQRYVSQGYPPLSAPLPPEQTSLLMDTAANSQEYLKE